MTGGLRKHWAALTSAWSSESKRRRDGAKQWVETDFLPAALEVVETPPSPIGRGILWTIIAAALVALLWAIFSKVDVVAVAEGRIVPVGRLQVVNSGEPGVVRAIMVREGERVVAGQPLLELDPTQADADAETARTELSTAVLTRARANALLAYAASRQPEFIVGALPPGLTPNVAAIEAERQLVDARIREYEAKRASLQQRRLGADAAADAAGQEVQKLQDTLPLAEQQLAARKNLEARGLMAPLLVMEVEERVITMRRDLMAQRTRAGEARAQVSMFERDLVQAAQEFRGAAAQEKAEAEAIVATRDDAVRKADQRQSLQRLTAPVTGVVQEVAVTTIGGAVEANKTLVTIVPDGDELIIEALVLNKDAGFVKAGDPAVIKLEAFPFTRYGTLKGRVLQVSPDAIVDERRGLVFPARINLSDRQLLIDGRRVPVFSGMSTTVEIVTGERRVIEYLWSPVARASREAGRER